MRASCSTPSPFMSSAEVSVALGISQRTLQQWTKAGTGPPAVKVTPGGRSLRYRREDVARWVRGPGVDAVWYAQVERAAVGHLMEAGYTEEEAHRVITVHLLSGNTGLETMQALGLA